MANMIPIQTVTVGSSGASVIDFTNIPQNYTDLKLVVSGRQNAGGGAAYARLSFNNDATTTNTTFRNMVTEGSTTVSTYAQSAYGTGGETLIGALPGTTSTFGYTEIYIPNYSSYNIKPYSINSAIPNLLWWWQGSHLYNSTRPITAIKYTNSSYNLTQHTTATLYGIRKY
jgi:hypothetical protein